MNRIKNYIHSLLILLLCMIGANVSAHDIEVPNADGVTIYYNYINDNTELAVTFEGNWDGYTINEYSGVVVIPEEVTIDGHTLKVTRINNSAFSECYELFSATIPKSITSIGDYAFAACISMTSIIMGNNVESIGNYAFAACQSLTSVTIPDKVTSIGEYAFYKCYGLTYFDTGNGVTSIGKGAFKNCTSLSSVNIGRSVTSIGELAFKECLNLNDVYCYAEQVPETGKDVFMSSNYTNATLHVPAGSVNAYKAAAPWKNFKRIVAIE